MALWADRREVIASRTARGKHTNHGLQTAVTTQPEGHIALYVATTMAPSSPTHEPLHRSVMPA